MEKRYKFTPNQWIIFDYKDGCTAIGYTNYKGSLPIIVFATDASETGSMPYSEVVNPRKLRIETKATNNIRKSIEMPTDVIINFRKGEA